MQGKEIALKKAAAKGSKAEQKAKKKSAEDEVRSLSCKQDLTVRIRLNIDH